MYSKVLLSTWLDWLTYVHQVTHVQQGFIVEIPRTELRVNMVGLADLICDDYLHIHLDQTVGEVMLTTSGCVLLSGTLTSCERMCKPYSQEH